MEFKAALAFFYCAYYPRIFSSMFCGEITSNRRQLYRFRVFKIADLKTSRTRRFGGKFAKHGSKKNNSFRNIISYNSANAAEMNGPFEECLHRLHPQRQRQKLAIHHYIDSRDINPTGSNKVSSKDSYYTCSRQLRMTCAGD